jgi:hypothetical protein
VSDGCEKMAGWKTGVYASMEKIFKTTFGRVEKSFETIILLYTGHTTSPGTFFGSVGQAFKGDVHKRDVVNFH